MWIELDSLSSKHNIYWNWVQGNKYNNEVDELERNEILNHTN